MEIVDFGVVADDGDDGGKQQRDGNRPDEGDGESSHHLPKT